MNLAKASRRSEERVGMTELGCEAKGEKVPAWEKGPSPGGSMKVILWRGGNGRKKWQKG